MAAFDTTRPVVGFSFGRISSVIAGMFGTIAAWNDARVTRKSLSKLSARELDDTGLCYGDIDTIADRITR